MEEFVEFDVSGEQNGDMMDDLMAELQVTKPKKKSKKKKAKAAAADADDNNDASVNHLDDTNDFPDITFDAAPAGSGEPEDEGLDGLMAELELTKPKKSKKKKKAKAAQAADDEEDIDAVLNELGDGPTAPEASLEVAPVKPDEDGDGGLDDLMAELAVSKPKKDKKKKKKSGKAAKSADGEEDIDAILNELGDDPSAPQASPEVAASKSGENNDDELDGLMAELADTKPKKDKKKKQKAKASKTVVEEEDIDAILNELGDGPSVSQASPEVSLEKPSEPVEDGLDGLMAELEENKPKKGKKKKKKGGKAEKPADGGEDIDALLSELGDAPSAPQESPEVAAVKSGEPVDDGLGGLMAELEGSSASAAKKKKAKRKAKKAQKGADGDESSQPAEAAAPQKPKKKESAVVRRARENLERQRAAEEAERKRVEEEERQIAEEERLRKEAEEKKAEARARKKAAEKARIARQKAEGTYLTKAQKEQRRKAEAYKAQLRAQGLLPMDTDKDEGGSTNRGPRVYESKRRRGKPSAPANTTPEAPKPEESNESWGVIAPAVTESNVEPTKEDKTDPVVEPKSDAAENVADNWEDDVPDDWAVEEELKEPEPEEPEAKEDKDPAKSSAKATEKKVDVKKAEQHDGAREEDEDDDLEEEEDEDSDDDSSDYSESEDEFERKTGKNQMEAAKRLAAVRRAHEKARQEAYDARSPDHLRSPVICIMGHVDTGKTKILDRIRKTNVQDGEAGGITQQIGATYFPIDAVKKETMKLEEGKALSYNVPALLIIDTPGHESFTNLRKRGSGLCDIAILVIDIMHGIEPQTRESIQMLKHRKTPFIVALNKIDRIYDWNAQPNNCPTRKSLNFQKKHAKQEFQRRVDETKLALSQEGFNSELYWKNDDFRKTISLVPTSAITGEGMPDLLMLLLDLPQKLLKERLMFNSYLEATVLEVKAIEGHGTTIDIILTGGTIHQGDTIVVLGKGGIAVDAKIRALLTPHPMKEMRVKGQYQHHESIKAAEGVKIAAEGLENALAGTQLVVVKDPENEDEMAYARKLVVEDFKSIASNVEKFGVYVNASTLGSLEALMSFLKDSKIPVMGTNIGPVHKKDVVKSSTMLERKPELAMILAFDVKVEAEAQEIAGDVGVTIYTADIIYHLFDMFKAHMEEVKRKKREESSEAVVFPSINEIIPTNVYNKKQPIVLGVNVVEGILRVGTPLAILRENEWFVIGRVVDMRNGQDKSVRIAKQSESVCLKIASTSAKNENVMFGRHFDANDKLVSRMTRRSIDLLKESFREDLSLDDWKLVKKLKTKFNIE